MLCPAKWMESDWACDGVNYLFKSTRRVLHSLVAALDDFWVAFYE
jgi:hypothetical protein